MTEQHNDNEVNLAEGDRRRRDLAAEVAPLEADEVDRAEMRAVAALMPRCVPTTDAGRFSGRGG